MSKNFYLEAKEKRAAIFSDTQKFYQENSDLKNACAKSLEGTKCYKAEEKLCTEKNRFSEKVKIVVSKKRSFEAASFYCKAENSPKVLVLNFANSFHPGGGVVRGSGAQEECLCRTSTLYSSINSKKMFSEFYLPHRESEDSLATDDVIFTPNVTVFKSDTDFPELLPKEKWFSVDVITCAAPNISYGYYDLDSINDEILFDLQKSRVKRILEVALLNSADVLILGAFGCGAFGNPPEIVAKAFKTVIEEFQYSFRTIEFAVYCSARDAENFTTFNSVFCR